MEPVIGLVLDDIGLGSDGSCWGGELLSVDGSSFERLGHLLPLAKPGGDIAHRETWRMAAGVLHRLQRPDEISRRYTDHPASTDLVTMLAEGRNCPPTSCAALLIATAANLLRLGVQGNHQDDAVHALEAAALDYFAGDYAPVSETHWHINGEGKLDMYPLLANLVDEPDAQRGAATFHASLISGATEWVAKACDSSATRKVVLAGSCLQNQLLASGLRANLERRSLAVYEAQQIAPDDSSIALGQAWVAQHALRNL
jgi:hydrogenase maturation protein HypF